MSYSAASYSAVHCIVGWVSPVSLAACGAVAVTLSGEGRGEDLGVGSGGRRAALGL